MLAMVGDNKRIPPSRSGALAPTLLRALNGWSDACELGRVWSVVGCVVVVGTSRIGCGSWRVVKCRWGSQLVVGVRGGS